MRGVGDEGGTRDGEAISEEAVVGDAEFAGCFEQAEHGVAGDLAGLADGAAGDFALGHDGADVVLPAVGVERDLGAVELAQEIGYRSEPAACLVGSVPREYLRLEPVDLAGERP